MPRKKGGLNIIEYCGKRLFQFFREQQKTHGNDGCMCKICKTDMVNAFKKLVGDDLNKK